MASTEVLSKEIYVGFSLIKIFKFKVRIKLIIVVFPRFGPLFFFLVRKGKSMNQPIMRARCSRIPMILIFLFQQWTFEAQKSVVELFLIFHRCFTTMYQQRPNQKKSSRHQNWKPGQTILSSYLAFKGRGKSTNKTAKLSVHFDYVV